MDRSGRSLRHFLWSLSASEWLLSRSRIMLLLLHLSNAQDMLGRWSLIPVLAVGLCLWTKWKTRQDECRLEQSKLEEVR